MGVLRGKWCSGCKTAEERCFCGLREPDRILHLSILEYLRGSIFQLELGTFKGLAREHWGSEQMFEMRNIARGFACIPKGRRTSLLGRGLRGTYANYETI